MDEPGAWAVDVWSHWSLLKALGSPAAVVQRARDFGYEGVLLADWRSLTGAFELVEAAERQDVAVLVGLTLPLGGAGGGSVRVVGTEPTAWSRLTRLATAGRVEQVEELSAPDLLVIVGPDCAPGVAAELAARIRRLFQLVTDPSQDWTPGAIPLAALPFRYLPGQERAWELLARISHEPQRPGTAWVSAAALRERFGPQHPAVLGWGSLAAVRGRPAVPPAGRRLPEWPEAPGDQASRALEQAAQQGLRERLSGVPEAYHRRLQRELAVIAEQGVAAYFLIVADLVRHARERGIRVGPGRGSAAASLVAWALGITEVDPLVWGLVFERFLNPARKSLPDIDLDIEDTRRGELVAYLQERWGREHVAQIGSYGTFGARAAIRDAGRALGVDATVVDALARLVPQSPDITLERARAAIPELDLRLRDPELAELAQVAGTWEGAPRHPSVHAAGVVVAPDPIVTWSPLQPTSDAVVTALPMEDLERLGLLKLDLLGLRTLTVIRAVQAAVDAPLPPLGEVAPADPPTLALLAHGETEGVFQLDGRGAKDLLRRLEPAGLDDVMLAVALIRPGPMEHIQEYLTQRRTDRAREGHTSSLDATGGVLVFQEQLMALVRDMAGYSWAEADLFRRAVSKKDRALLDSERARFLGRAVERGADPREAEAAWQRIAAFADYGFNKAHAVAYGLLAYYLAYLKAHWPLAFWAAELGSRGHGEALGRAVAAAWREGLPVLRPHVNASRDQPWPDGGAVRLALDAVRGVGQEASRRIVAARRDAGPYTDVGDLKRRLGADWFGRIAGPLQRAGALDGLAGAEEDMAAGAQMTWWEGSEPGTQRAPGADADLEVLGWRWPEPDGYVYVQVEQDGPSLEADLARAAALYPGEEVVVVAERRSRAGRRLGLKVEGHLWALRALYGRPGVLSASRGLAGSSAGRRESLI